MPDLLTAHPELLGLLFVATIGTCLLAGVVTIWLGVMLDAADRAKRIGKPKARTVIRG